MVRPASLLLFALVLTLLAGSAAAQELDDAWFKVKFKTRGVALALPGDAPGDKPPKAKLNGVVYMHFVHVFVDDDADQGGADGVVPGVTYSVTIWSEVFPDSWMPGLGSDGTPGTFLFFLQGPGETTLDATDITVYAPALDLPVDGGGAIRAFDGQMSGSFKLKLKDDALKSASFRTWGGVITDGTPDGGDSQLFGSFSMRGKTIDPAQLPFDPEP